MVNISSGFNLWCHPAALQQLWTENFTCCENKPLTVNAASENDVSSYSTEVIYGFPSGTVPVGLLLKKTMAAANVAAFR